MSTIRVVTSESKPMEWAYIEDAMEGRTFMAHPASVEVVGGFTPPTRPAQPAVAIFGQGPYAESYTPEPPTQWGMFALGAAFGIFVGLVVVAPLAAWWANG